jgi:hypothetical protein
MKKKLLISFSGGKTSAFMVKWLWDNKQDEYDMIVVFANTGKENGATLDFIHKFETVYNIPVQWIEARAVNQIGVGTHFIKIDYFSASREGEPFESVIKKYGLPNTSAKHCTRELKRNIIRKYANSIGWKGYYTAIGIRADEIDRISEAADKDRLIYPLIKECITKAFINDFWNNEPFTLKLEEHQGNCDCCFKKSFKKLRMIANESPEKFEWWRKMEEKYGTYAAPNQKGLQQKIKDGKRISFYRGNTTANHILNAVVSMDAMKTKDNCSESCEPF